MYRGETEHVFNTGEHRSGLRLDNFKEMFENL